MEQTHLDEQPQVTPEQPVYVPRPRWQVWLARICLALFLLTLIAYYLFYFRGGQF